MLKTVVPAMPHEILLHHKKIEEPWKPFGMEKCFWVSENDWVYDAELAVSNPELWWPRGYGKQNLYKAEFSLSVNGTVHQKETRTIGFRKIEMPESLLHFTVNGKTVFLRGGNWVTPNLMSDVWDAERVRKLFDLAENANFNAFRIWGPVEAPGDNFYEMADERGFLLWQDFTRMPFNPDEESLKITSEKSSRFIKRLKHHPSVLLWCGVNESAMWSGISLIRRV